MISEGIALAILSKKFVGASTFALGVVALTVDPMIFSAAAVLVIGAIAAAAVTIINALAAGKKELLELQAEIMTKQAEILTITSVTQGHVDGMTTAAAAKRTADENTILDLRKQLADKDRTAAVLAQSTADVKVIAPIAATVELGTVKP